MIDIHCHLLPEIDDGADDLATALAMARLAVADGITHAVLTPHIHPGRWNNTAAAIAAATVRFAQALDENSIPLNVGHAAEVRISEAIFKQIEEGAIPYLGRVDGYQIMLLEFPHSHVLPGSEKLIAWLLRKGVRPLIAHPERNREVMANPACLKRFIDMGCLVQVTAGAFTGRFGDKARHAACYFLEHNQIDLVASDAHNTRARPPVLSAALDFISRTRGEEEARRLVMDNPWRLVSGQFEGGHV